MKKTVKRGRPKLPKKLAKADILSIRLNPAERKEIAEAVKKSGGKFAKWARTVLLCVARGEAIPKPRK